MHRASFSRDRLQRPVLTKPNGAYKPHRISRSTLRTLVHSAALAQPSPTESDSFKMANQTLLRTLVLAPLLIAGSCQAVYLGTLEKFGYEKREILHERIEAAGESIIVFEQRLKETFAVYSEAIHQEGGDLLSIQKRFSNFYDSTEDASSDLASRIDKIQSVANPMFEQWSDETGEIMDSELRLKSRANNTQALVRYNELLRSMRAVQAKTDPLLTRLRDHVLFMKLNVHPNAYASLRKTEKGFLADFDEASKAMNATYEDVQDFLKFIAF